MLYTDDILIHHDFSSIPLFHFFPFRFFTLPFPLSFTSPPLFFIYSFLFQPTAAMKDPRPLPPRHKAERSLKHWQQDFFFFFIHLHHQSFLQFHSPYPFSPHPPPASFFFLSTVRSLGFDSIFVPLTLLYLFSTPTLALPFPFYTFFLLVLGHGFCARVHGSSL